MDTIASVSLPFEEDRVWTDSIRPWLEARAINGDAIAVAHYVATEMLNNARDHSGASSVEVLGDVKPSEFILRVIDTGVGLFQRLATGLALTGPREALVEICKGKRTTDPAHHTGQGIFFSSKVCDWFRIETNGLGVSFMIGRPPELLQFPNRPDQPGTVVTFSIKRNPTLTLRQVFDEFCPQPDIQFNRTEIGMRLMNEVDGALVSRSQGRRLMAGLDSFSEVVLDFREVATIEQGFADEVFRVWRNAHPEVRLKVINAGVDVQRMLKHTGFSTPR